MNYCALIPSYNEERTIGGIIKQLKAGSVVVYIVDDGSTDATYSIAVSEGAVVIRHEKNMGKGASLREGFKHILKKGYDAILVIDGDNQHEIDSIDDFIRKMDETGADMVIGNRMADTASMPIVRNITNRFMSWLISKICGQRVPDTQCGFRLIKTRLLEKIKLESSNFEIESEIILKASGLGFKIESVPIKAVYQDEKSRINPVADTIRFIYFMIKSAFKK
ncbi:MAG: glycosyltransferase family 2 protein [Candidatus Omnitrophota bacterium]|nr:glycosyltransferase family 2 protein [Candidatus Omnitrophota bacterium]